MKKFIINSILFIIVIFILFAIGDYIVSNGLKKSEFGDFKEWNGIFNGSFNSDLIINGDSRANVNISPLIIDSILNLNSYNLGMTGYHFYMQDCRFKLYLQKNVKPKIIIHSLSSITLKRKNDLLDYEQFLPYLENEALKDATKRYIGLTPADYILPFYRYRSKFTIIKNGFFEFFNLYHTKAINYKGYNGITSKWRRFDKFKNDYLNKKISIDDESKFLFSEYLNYCKNNNIEIYLVYTPEYIEAQEYVLNRNEIIEMYKVFSEKYEIPFLDYSHDSMSYDKTLFFDSQHLNKKGAEQFSLKLANDIKRISPLVRKKNKLYSENINEN